MKHTALTVIILFILLCGCGGVGGHKKHRTAKPEIPPEVVEATYESQIRVLMSLWRTASLTKVGIDEQPVRRAEGPGRIKAQPAQNGG